MTQEEHWKKAFQDLRAQIETDIAKQAAAMTTRHNRELDSIKDLAGKINTRKEEAEKLIDQMESLLFFVNDDIRSSIALDTVARIDHTLRLVKEFRYGMQKAKPKSKPFILTDNQEGE